MKTIKSIILFLSINLFFSCSNDKSAIQFNEQQQSSNISRGLPPPTPGDLRGFYDVKFNNGIEANFIFEYGNYVTSGSPTITDMLSQSGLRTTYSMNLGAYEFTMFDGVNTYNYRMTYDNINSKFSGTYGTGLSYNNVGTFKGKKHFIGISDFSFAKGYWLGYYTVNPGGASNDYVMVFEENGKLTVAANETLYGSSPASGTYTIIGNSIIGSYTYLSGGTYSFKADLLYGSNAIIGTWGYGSSNSNGGGFNLDSWNFY